MTTEAEVYEALKYLVEVDPDGTRRYYNSDGLLHRELGPAVEYANGTKFWYQNGLRHRTDGPASEWCDGVKHWYLYGMIYTKSDYHVVLAQLGSKHGS